MSVAVPAVRAFGAVLIVALATPTDTSAAPWAPKKPAAREMLNAAADAAEAGDFERSAELSLKSLSVEPSIFARWNAGQAYMDAGAWARALEQYDLALADAELPRKQRPRIEVRKDLARAFIDAGAAADAGRWDESRAGYLGILDREDLTALDRQHAGTALERLAERRAEAAARPEPAPTERPTEPTSAPAPTTPLASPITEDTVSRSRWSDTTALAIVGAGVIGVGAGGWFVMRAGDLDDEAAAVDTPEADREGLRDRADRSRTGAVVAFAAGGALVLAGAIKLAIPPEAPRPSHASIQPTKGGALLVIGGRF